MNATNGSNRPGPPPGSEAARALESALLPEDTPGARVGHYKLLQEIGEGGFGVVWMAEQEEPIRRRVALKIVKPGMDTKEVVTRFEAERQALALMDHPNIAQVFEAGATKAGRPYFVMELVRGVPITRYCDENRLTPEARLRLFVPVCQAVQHAHHKGVIHRDLKPSNILVTLHDGVPVPKIIDFGIAKALQGRLTDKTLFTQFHAFVGTPAYTSPEQMEMSGLDVDTRSDIYSLGVLLYELLAGRPPFDPDALAKSGLDAMRRTIREVDPPRPSRRLGTLSEADRTSVAHQRRTEVAKLALFLRGDVDWIVMHCLEKDRMHRYDTAAALAMDIQHHLRSEPVTARPPSELYRMGKFVRRHRVGVAAVGTIALLLVGGVITTSTLFLRERAAHRRAVVAEQSESRLRQQAETARTVEARRASRTAQAMAEQLFREHRSAEAFAHLVRAARSDPENFALGPRLVAALAFRSFAEPVGEPMVHAAPIRSVGYFNHTRRCWTVTWDGSFRIWNLDDGRLERTISCPDVSWGIVADPGWGAISADETRMLTGHTDGSIYLWSLQTGERVLGSLRHEQRVTWVEYSPDGKWLASASDDHTAKIWDATTGALKAVLAHDSALNGIVFSPDSSRVLTCALRGQWRIWRVPDGEPVTPFGTSIRRVDAGAFSPDGTLVVVPDNSGAQLFDAATGARVGARLQHSAPCYRVAFSPDGKKLATTSDDTTAQFWEVPSGRPLLAPLQHGGSARWPMFTPDGRALLTSSSDGIARVWDVATGALALEPIRAGEYPHIAVSRDGGEFLCQNGKGVVQRWRLAPGAIMPFQLPSEPERVAVGPDAHGAMTAWLVYRDHLQKIDLASGRKVDGARLFPTPVAEAFLSPDSGCLFVTLASGESELWNLSRPEITRHAIGTYAGAALNDSRRRHFAPDSSRFALLDNSNRLRVWNTATGALILGPVENALLGWEFSATGRRLATPLADDTVVLWDLATGNRMGEPLRPQSLVRAAGFSPDERMLATGTFEGMVQLWDTNTQRRLGSPLSHRWFVRGVTWAHDGRRLLTWCPLDARVWDVATGKPLTEPLVAAYNVQDAVFSEDDTRIATHSRTGNEVFLWDSVSGQLLADAIHSPFFISSFFGFLDHDRFLARSGLAANQIFIWPMPPPPQHRPVPEWLLRLATAVAGGEIDARAVFREQAVEAKTFAELRRELAALPADAPYTEWGRWFLADRDTRPIGPGFKITRAEADQVAAAWAAGEIPSR
jgi:WD40 repeat protein/serine/threonine protein kinase